MQIVTETKISSNAECHLEPWVDRVCALSTSVLLPMHLRFFSPSVAVHRGTKQEHFREHGEAPDEQRCCSESP